MFFSILHSQQTTSEKLNFYLQSTLAQMEDDDQLGIALHGDREALIEYAVRKRTRFYPLENGVMLKLNKAEIIALNDLDFVDHVEFDLQNGQPFNDQMLLNNNVLPVHQGIFPLNSEYSGKGVLIGVIDSGIELLHPDFLDENDETRVLYLWDHLIEDNPDLIPLEYGYGNVWTKEDIDAGLSTHLDQIQYFGHGSVVTGVAASDGSAIGQFKGVAPDCNLIVVNSDFDRPDWAASIVDAVDFIYMKASELNMPCVINASIGSYFGSHDGLDANTLAINDLIEAEDGRSFVCAAGNSGSISSYHLKYPVINDTSFTWFKYAVNTIVGSPSVFFELWADTADFNQVQFGIAADKVVPNYSKRGESNFRNIQDNLDQVLSDDIIGVNGDIIANVQTWATVRGGQYQLQVFLDQPDSVQYYYRFMTTGQGTFDIWSTEVFGSSSMVLEDDLPTVQDFPDIEFYQLPDGKQRIASSWACSDITITTGNYVNRSEYLDYNGNIEVTGFEQGEISPTSSQGPTRDGRLKPDLAATGAFTLSSGSFEMLNWLINNEPFKVAPGGFHNRNGGTSMASPVLAGVAALIYEQCPYANNDLILDALRNHGVADSYTGTVPNDLWGEGKIDAFGAVNSLTVLGELTIDGDALIASGGIDYHWYLGDSLVAQGTDEYVPSQNDFVKVEIVDSNGCVDWEEIFYSPSNIENAENLSIEIYPNPVSINLFIDGINNKSQVRIFDAKGKQVSIDWISLNNGRGVIDVSKLSEASYFVEINAAKSYPILVKH